MAKVRERSIKDYTSDQENANKGTRRGREMLQRSLRRYGAARSIVATADDRIPAGNKTLEAAEAAGITKVIEVETTGEELVVVKRRDWSSIEEAREYAYMDNRANETSLDWDPERILADLNAGVDLKPMWSEAELASLVNKAQKEAHGKQPDEDEQEEGEQEEDDEPGDDPLKGYLPPMDFMWPSEEQYDIPLLDASLQAKMPILPIVAWGSAGRLTRGAGTYHFYVDDYRFSGLWSHPEKIVYGQAACAVEPNFTMGPHIPRAMALWLVYQKRWIARYWQVNGIHIFVDLNTNPRWHDIDLLGVPKGWKAYASRGYQDRIDGLLLEYEHAVQHAGGSDGLVFMVYGGGKVIEQVCKQHGWIHAYEHMDVKPHAVKEHGDTKEDKHAKN